LSKVFTKCERLIIEAKIVPILDSEALKHSERLKELLFQGAVQYAHKHEKNPLIPGMTRLTLSNRVI